MRIKCPHCGVNGKADRSLSGRTVGCPKCSTVFLVPDARAIPSPLPESGPEDAEDVEAVTACPLADEAAPDLEMETLPDDAAEGADCIVQDQLQAAEAAEEELRAELEEMLAATCRICGKSVDDKPGRGGSGGVYCDNCLGKDFDRQGFNDSGVETAAAAGRTDRSGRAAGTDLRRFTPPADFSAVDLIKESRFMINGVKGALWAGMGIVFLLLFALGAGVVSILSHGGGQPGFRAAAWVNLLSLLISMVLSIIFLSGLINIGIKRVRSQSFSWRLVFSGFSHLGTVLLAGLLMSLLIAGGLLLFVLPGIYLAVGYSLTLPLIMDRGVGPWEAMEMSRRAIHDKWWQVSGTYLLMSLLSILSMIPFGIGLIWTVPMFFMLTAILYSVFFGQDAEE